MTTHNCPRPEAASRLRLRSRGFSKLCAAALLMAAFVPALAVCHASDFTPPTKEELQMKSLPGYPGVPAVVLYREEITKDDLHEVLHYDRIKILTEEGKKYADVELGYYSTTGYFVSDNKNMGDVSGRTIQPDGTIIPYTGKPYKKTIMKTEGGKYQAIVFTLPDVEVGSIIEYRYATRINDNVYEAPDWIIQGDLYIKSAHFAWYPTIQPLVDQKGQLMKTITWFPILPMGAEIKHTVLPPTGFGNASQQIYDLSIKDVPPTPDEKYMPPVANYSYRVLFNFSPYHSSNEFWQSEGKDWSKRVNSFEDPNSNLKDATRKIVAGATTDDARLRAIYAAVMAFENTDYTREHEAREDKANGLAKMKNADDVLRNKRGNSTELAELFVGMARAAGMKADLMLVPDRSKHVFLPGWWTFRQLDDAIAVVNVDGKDRFFDPGSRYCPYGQLAWWHTFVQGLRQQGNEAVFATSPGGGYAANRLDRVANLTMDSQGQITGRIDLTFVGAPALRWREMALLGDQESLKRGLRKYLENMIPRSFDVEDVGITNTDDYEQPLKVSYTVSGTMGSHAGKLLVMPADLFLADAQATFPEQKRDISVYFHYPQIVQDALRLNLPANVSVDAVPSGAKFNLPKTALYDMTVTSAPNNFTTRRTFIFADFVVMPAGYASLRNFYSQFEANDQQSVVLKSSPVVAATTTAPNGMSR